MVYELHIWWQQPLLKYLAYGEISRVSRLLGRVNGDQGEPPRLDREEDCRPLAATLAGRQEAAEPEEATLFNAITE